MDINQILKDLWDEGVRTPLEAKSLLGPIVLSKKREGNPIEGDIPDTDSISQLFLTFKNSTGD